MPMPTSLRSLPWRPAVGLLLAGLLGWLAAWAVFSTASGGAPAGLASPPTTAATAPAPTAAAAAAGPTRPLDESARVLDQLLQNQAKVSDGATRSVIALPPPPTAAGAGSTAAPPPGTTPAKDPAREAKLKAFRDLQATAMAEIKAVPPGDTAKMMVAMERFDAQMRAAGAPSIIDMERLRQLLEGTNRMQELGRQITAESEKGRNADAAKVQALAAQLQALQKQMPQQFIKPEVLQKQLAR